MSWVEQAIRQGMEEGKFDDLPGAGQPLKDIDRPHDDLWWVKDKLRREEVSFLPPSLALRKEIEDAATAAVAAPTELGARRIIAAANEKVREAIRIPPPGPSISYRPLNTDGVMEQWHAAHPAPVPQEKPPAPEKRRRWRLRPRSDRASTAARRGSRARRD